MGFHAKEEVDIDYNVGNLLSLAVYQDTCANTQQLYFSRDLNEKITKSETEGLRRGRSGRGRDGDEHWLMTAIGTAILIYIVLANCLLCYCCIKNRGKIMTAYRSANPDNARGGEIDSRPRQPDQRA
jgi:hypothetical protein